MSTRVFWSGLGTSPAGAVVSVVVAVFGLQLVVGFVVAAVAASTRAPGDAPWAVAPWLLQAETVAAEAAAVVVLAMVVRRATGFPAAAEWGLRPVSWTPAMADALTGLIVIGASGVAVQALSPPQLTHGHSTILLGEGPARTMFAVAAAAVAVPILEELIFRGFLFGALYRWRGFWPAALISSLVFTAGHVVGRGWLLLVPIAIVGLVNCLLYRRTGSLLVPIATHCLNNTLAVGAANQWPRWAAPLVAVSLAGTLIAGLGAVLRRGLRAARSPA